MSRSLAARLGVLVTITLWTVSVAESQPAAPAVSHPIKPIKFAKDATFATVGMTTDVSISEDGRVEALTEVKTDKWFGENCGAVGVWFFDDADNVLFTGGGDKYCVKGKFSPGPSNMKARLIFHIPLESLHKIAAVSVVHTEGDRSAAEQIRENIAKALGSRQPLEKQPQMAWNVWAEDAGGRSFRPVPFLKLASDYLVTLDLAAFTYERSGVHSSLVPTSFREIVQGWLDGRLQDVNLTVVMLHDPAAFERPSEPVQPLRVDLRKVATSITRISGDPFDAMRALPPRDTPQFTFGRVEFDVRTGVQVGSASLSFSIWAKGRPVDEMTAHVCIAPDQATADERCREKGYVAYGLKGVDLVRLATEGASAPDAALHFVEMPHRIYGVLWRKAEPEVFLSWPLDLDTTASWLEDYLGTRVLPAFFTEKEDGLLNVGEGLYNVLFPDKPDNPEAAEARKAFDGFVRDYPRVSWEPQPTFLAPSIFVRMVLPSLRTDLMVPLGLMAVNNDFVGYSFRVETPLPLQTYESATACVSRWVIVVPPVTAGGPLQKARAVIKDRIEKWKQVATVHQAMPPFRQWLTREGPETGPLALAVTSHHGRDTIWLEENDKLFSKEIRRNLPRSSIAILNGCGTGGPGATDFVGELNKRGVSAVIATSTPIAGGLAGTFIDCLSRLVEADSGAAAFSLSQAHFAAVHCARNRKVGSDTMDPDTKETYGGRALAYMLLGNGSLRLCSPGRND